MSASICDRNLEDLLLSWAAEFYIVTELRMRDFKMFRVGAGIANPGFCVGLGAVSFCCKSTLVPTEACVNVGFKLKYFC